MDKIGKYKILGVLGKGGMGIVYKALDPDIEREVAIKTIRFDNFHEGTQKDDLMARFIREARAAGKLAHPNIVTVYDVGREEDLTYIVMQYVEGQSLQGLIDSGKRLSPQEIDTLMKPVSDALDYAHNNGIVHRDIKPANILIDKANKPFLADFGVARMDTSTMTQSGTAVGTLSYMSPEQIKGHTVDRRSDIFALGIILYELLSGKMPFDGDNISTIVYKIVNEQPRRITEINKDIPAGYDLVIQKTLAKNPEDRYQTCRQLIGGLESAGKILEQTLAFSVEKKARAAGGAKRKTGLIAALGLAGIGAVVGAIVLFSPKSSRTAGAGQKAGAIKTSASATKPAESPPVPLVNDSVSKSGPAGPSDEDLSKLKEAVDQKKYADAAKLAQDILAKFPSDPAVQDYLKKARSGLVSGQVAPFLQSGISSYNQGNFAQCVKDMEKVLNLDKDSAEAQRYLFQADTALSKKDILALIERHRAAEESKDLLTVLSDVSSPALSGQWQGEYKMLFNGYDGIASSVSGISVNFSGRTEATASFSHLLTAVYKKDGKKKIVFEGTKAWHLRRQGKAWTLTGTG
ncbi:MAG: serine/threonine-protein kinase [Candidatus Aminicenantes bacterium]|nr:serine/threonine-protein kinase [Candidatus Aminicenantes bacterium]